MTSLCKLDKTQFVPTDPTRLSQPSQKNPIFPAPEKFSMMQFRQNSDDILKIYRIYYTKTIITFKFDWQLQTSWYEEKKLFLLFSPKKKTICS